MARKTGDSERERESVRDEGQLVQAKHLKLIAHTAQFGSSYVGVIRLMKKYIYERNLDRRFSDIPDQSRLHHSLCLFKLF